MVDIVIFSTICWIFKSFIYSSFENALAIRAKRKLFHKCGFVKDFVVIFLYQEVFSLKLSKHLPLFRDPSSFRGSQWALGQELQN